MHTAVLTSLFPTPARPYHGIFVKHRWHAMAKRDHDIKIIQPLPRTPPAPFDLLLGRERVMESRAPRKEDRNDFTVYRPSYFHIPRKPVTNAQRFGKVAARFIHKLNPRPDIVVCDYAWPAAKTIQFLCEDIPVVVHGRGSDVTQIPRYPFLRKELQECLTSSGNWCGVSQNLVDRLDELGNIPNRGMLTPNGVDMSIFHPGDQTLARKTLGISSDRPIVLVVGHLIGRKRPLLALESFLEGTARDAQLVFIGHGRMENKLRNKISQSPLRDRVFILNEIEQERLALWYRAADVLLITSSREGRPNVVLEALASGLPVVATKTHGSAELLKHLPEFLAPIGDPRRIGRCLSLALNKRLPSHVWSEQVTHLTWRNACDKLEEMMQAAIDRNRR